MVEAGEVRLRDKPYEVAVALLRCGQERQVVRVAFSGLARGQSLAIRPIGGRDVRLDADDRANPVLQRLVKEMEGSEHVAVIGDRDSGHAQLGDPATELGESIGAV